MRISKPAADEEKATKPPIAKNDPEPVNLDKITPAEIADRIEEARKRYASVEYTATIEQTRNTSAFQTDVKADTRQRRWFGRLPN
jgi:hypothetical protein